jgi:hypothetical protein
MLECLSLKRPHITERFLRHTNRIFRNGWQHCTQETTEASNQHRVTRQLRSALHDSELLILLQNPAHRGSALDYSHESAKARDTPISFPQLSTVNSKPAIDWIHFWFNESIFVRCCCILHAEKTDSPNLGFAVENVLNWEVSFQAPVKYCVSLSTTLHGLRGCVATSTLNIST